MRVIRFLAFIGLVLILLSFTCPIIAPSYSPHDHLESGYYQGIMIHCGGQLAIHITSEENIPFTTYILDYENGVKALQEGSLENVTVVHSYTNRTVLNEYIPIPELGWYSVLITPSTNESLSFFEVTIENPSPNPGLLYSGVLIVSMSLISFVILIRFKNE